jgi:hypothetical protein
LRLIIYEAIIMAKKAKESRPSKARKPGSTFTKKVTRGKNRGDTVTFKTAAGGKPFPTKVVKDAGKKNTSNVAKRKKAAKKKK